MQFLAAMNGRALVIAFLSLSITSLTTADAAAARGTRAARQARPTASAKNRAKPKPRAKSSALTKGADAKVKGQLRGLTVADPISKSEVVTAVRDGFKSYLNLGRSGGYHTIATWNELDPKTIRVKSVQIDEGNRDRLGYRIHAGERNFTAVVDILHRSRHGGPAVRRDIQIKGTIQLEKRLPARHIGGRVRSGKTSLFAEDMRYLGDRSTVGWID